MSPLHYYDSAIQLARNAGKELTEEEFELGVQAAREIERGYVLSVRPLRLVPSPYPLAPLSPCCMLRDVRR